MTLAQEVKFVSEEVIDQVSSATTAAATRKPRGKAAQKAEVVAAQETTVVETPAAEVAPAAPATRSMKNAERHEVYVKARAVKLAVPVAAQVSFDFKAWGEANPLATQEELNAKAQELIEAALVKSAPAVAPAE
jgi:hypothetical protein